MKKKKSIKNKNKKIQKKRKKNEKEKKMTEKNQNLRISSMDCDEEVGLGYSEHILWN